MDSLFRYFGLSDEDVAFAIEQMHFWEYVVSLSESYIQFGSLTEKQYNSMLKHFDKRGLNYLPYSLVRSNLYKSKSKGSKHRSSPTEVLFNCYYNSTQIQQ